MHRRIILGMLFPALAGCAQGPSGFRSSPADSALFDAMLTSRERLSNLAQIRGRPAEAAEAFAQYELILAELRDKSDRLLLPDGVETQLDQGQQEMRSSLGIAPDAAPRQVAAALDRFAVAFRAGQRGEATQALSQPFFTLGPQRTFALLEELPSMPAMEAAAANLALGPPGASEAAIHQRLHRYRLLRGSLSNWSR